jgi:ADP-ribose pyrophosphatase YjhB (NUDIX family)
VSREYPDRPFVGIGIVVLRPGEVLLVRRGKAPNIGSWSLPGGAQEVGERAEDAARRELLEETSLVVGELHLVANVDSITRDPDGRVRYHYAIIDFAARWIEGEPAPGDDVSEVIWASLDDLARFALWSEAHRVIAIARRLLSL